MQRKNWNNRNVVRFWPWWGIATGEISNVYLTQCSCSKLVYRFVLFLAKACNCHLVPLLLLHWFPIDQLAPPCCSRHHLDRFEARTFADPHHDVDPLPRSQISKLLKLKGETLPSVTHHKKQEAKSELHSESGSLPRSLLRTHHPPNDPRPTSHLFFSHAPKNRPTFGRTHFHCLLLMVQTSSWCKCNPPPPLGHRAIHTLRWSLHTTWRFFCPCNPFPWCWWRCLGILQSSGDPSPQSRQLLWSSLRAWRWGTRVKIAWQLRSLSPTSADSSLDQSEASYRLADQLECRVGVTSELLTVWLL